MGAKFIRLGIFVTVLFCVLDTPAQSETHFEGETLTYFLGKNASSVEVKNLKADYKCEMANESHYISQDGLELILQKNILNEIHLYKSSAVYGTYKGKLPKNLKFGMSSGDVKHLLGKPAISYNSGYCEYEFKVYALSCWFDSGRLSQVSISVKPL